MEGIRGRELQRDLDAVEYGPCLGLNSILNVYREATCSESIITFSPGTKPLADLAAAIVVLVIV